MISCSKKTIGNTNAKPVTTSFKIPLAIANILEPSDVLEALYNYNTTHSSAKKRTITGKDLIEVLKEYQRGFTQWHQIATTLAGFELFQEHACHAPNQSLNAAVKHYPIVR